MKEERKLDENAYLSITSTTYPDKAAGLINDTRSNVTHCLVMLFACPAPSIVLLENGSKDIFMMMCIP